MEVTGKSQKLTAEFHKAFNHPLSEQPVPLSTERAINRTIWTGEEVIAEFLHACSDNEQQYRQVMSSFLEGLEKAFLSQLKKAYPKTTEERIVAQVDALTDAKYFIDGTFNEMGVDSEPITQIVHDANMSKLFTDSEGNKYAKHDKDNGNKVIKSPEFYSPEPLIVKEIQRQMEAIVQR